MGQVNSSLGGAFLLAGSIIAIIAIYFIGRNGYAGRLSEIQNLGIAGVPNPDFFKFIWPLFLLTACLGYFWASSAPGIIWRWLVVLILTVFEAFFLFGTNDFTLFPLALVTAVFILLLLGESIYYLAVTLKLKIPAALLGFYFIWSIYAIYFIFAVLINLLRETC